MDGVDGKGDLLDKVSIVNSLSVTEPYVVFVARMSRDETVIQSDGVWHCAL